MGLVDSILSLPAPVLVGLSIALFVAYLVLRYPDRGQCRRRIDAPELFLTA